MDLSSLYFSLFCRIGRRETLNVIAELTKELKALRPELWVDVKGISASEKQEIFGKTPIGRDERPYGSLEGRSHVTRSS
jgi:hypothetical protein